MTHTHSPAPWQVADHGDGAAIADADGKRIASLRYKGSSISARVTPEECHANQHLMIAAPAMLVELRRTLAALEEMTTDEFSRGGDRPIRERITALLAGLA